MSINFSQPFANVSKQQKTAYLNKLLEFAGHPAVQFEVLTNESAADAECTHFLSLLKPTQIAREE